MRDLTDVGWMFDRRGYLAHSKSLSSKLAKFKVQGVKVQPFDSSGGVHAFYPIKNIKIKNKKNIINRVVKE